MPTVNETSPASSTWGAIPASDVSRRTFNPIRDVLTRPVQPLSTPKSTKEPISLSIGDPTVFGNFKTHPAAVEAVEESVRSYSFNGYPPSVGVPVVREAVAKKYSRPEAPLTADDVIMTSGCSGAVEMAISVLCNEGQNILLPRPGFCLYNTVAGSRNIEARLYNLLPEKSWEADLEQMESLIDDKTAAILINNPSNPCGSNFTKAHLNAILALCERRKIPLISDEIYADMVFSGQTFTPAATLTSTVPILTLGGLAKQWLVPGWRIGWILIHDRSNAFSGVRHGLFALSTLINGPCAIVQAAIPKIFDNVPGSFLPELCQQLEEHARILEVELNKVPGLDVITPQGAMYVMVNLDLGAFKDISSDADFCHQLKWEENVELLPGECFAYPGTFRVVITPPKDKLHIAAERIAAFCKRHHK
ncbi:putative tyrosine aminotransferase [Martensiomyces pterosporus]|nr:putative tyrosine aminotransferase [Martensiomyces pterosporus]